MIGKSQNQIPELPRLDKERYENIFKVYSNEDGQFFYNINNKIVIPETLDETIVNKIRLDRDLAWTILSYKLYNTMNLWWLLFLLNKPENIFYAKAGIEYKYISRDFIEDTLDSINSQIES